jgi:hypothetical protein
VDSTGSAAGVGAGAGAEESGEDMGVKWEGVSIQHPTLNIERKIRRFTAKARRSQRDAEEEEEGGEHQTSNIQH